MVPVIEWLLLLMAGVVDGCRCRWVSGVVLLFCVGAVVLPGGCPPVRAGAVGCGDAFGGGGAIRCGAYGEC